ncbi:MAG: hypothetical protein JSR62_03980 [Nitrospira sp.]|nr:hypothetical protein [Nitrospira sp.]
MFARILGLVILAFPYTIPAGLAAAAAPSAEAALLGGTVVSIDQEALLLTILFPTGESRALPVRDPRLLHGLSVGDHVTFELNHEHTLIKITKLPTDPAN